MESLLEALVVTKVNNEPQTAIANIALLWILDESNK